MQKFIDTKIHGVLCNYPLFLCVIAMQLKFILIISITNYIHTNKSRAESINSDNYI